MSDQIEFEPDKFIVINRKTLADLPPLISNPFLEALMYFEKGCDLVECKKHKYYVCNQDEPYADEVLKVILEGEQLKQAKTNTEKMCVIIDKKFSSDGGHQSGVVKCILCGSEVDYFVSTEDGFISFDCKKEGCLSGGSEDLINSEEK